LRQDNLVIIYDSFTPQLFMLKSPSDYLATSVNWQHLLDCYEYYTHPELFMARTFCGDPFSNSKGDTRQVKYSVCLCSKYI